MDNNTAKRIAALFAAVFLSTRTVRDTMTGAEVLKLADGCYAWLDGQDIAPADDGIGGE